MSGASEQTSERTGEWPGKPVPYGFIRSSFDSLFAAFSSSGGDGGEYDGNDDGNEDDDTFLAEFLLLLFLLLLLLTEELYRKGRAGAGPAISW